MIYNCKDVLRRVLILFLLKNMYLKNFSYLCTFELIHNFSNGKDYRDSKSEGRCR